MKRNLALAFSVLLLALLPLWWAQGSAFEGADGQAENAIVESHPNYEPWAEAWWTPPSSEIESLLFGIQAALGSGILCYTLGYYRGRRKGVV